MGRPHRDLDLGLRRLPAPAPAQRSRGHHQDSRDHRGLARRQSGGRRTARHDPDRAGGAPGPEGRQGDLDVAGGYLHCLRDPRGHGGPLRRRRRLERFARAD